MKTIRLRARTWCRYVVYAQFVIVPFAILTVLGFIGVIHRSWALVGFAVLLGFGLSGSVLKILMTLGKVQLVYNPSDMDSWLLRFGYKCDSESPFEHDRRGVILEDDDEASRSRIPRRVAGPQHGCPSPPQATERFRSSTASINRFRAALRWTTAPPRQTRTSSM